MARVQYEYAGFHYLIDTETLIAEPVPGQHHAVNKEKHRRAAVECWQQEQRNR